MKLTLTFTPPLLFLSIPGSPFTPYNRNNKEHLNYLQRTWENTSTSVKMIEQLSKYKELEIEISRIWGLKTEIVTVRSYWSSWPTKSGPGKTRGKNP